jgi:hypothetical protein
MNTFITLNTSGLSEMKPGHIASMLFLAILIAPMFVPVLAQPNHTLEWGVSLDERFPYVLQREYYSDSTSEEFMEGQLPLLANIQVGEKFILEIESLETIEEQINESSEIPLSHCNLRREDNDSIIWEDVLGFVLPIGDWEFLEELESATGLAIVETQDEWGTVGTGVIPGSGGNEISVYVETRYEKENGTLSYLRYHYSILGTDLIDVVFAHWYPGMPTVIGGEIQLATILIIAICGFTAVIVAFLVYRVIKGKKSIVQRLGE